MSTAKEWRAAGVVDLALPSGVLVRARRPSALQIAEWQKLPMGLTAAATGEQADTRTMAAAEMVEWAGFMREVLMATVVEPRITMSPQSEDEIHPRDIPFSDVSFIYGWAMRAEEVRALAGFRPKRADGDTGGDGGGVRTAAVEPVGDLGPGGGVEF